MTIKEFLKTKPQINKEDIKLLNLYIQDQTNREENDKWESNLSKYKTYKIKLKFIDELKKDEIYFSSPPDIWYAPEGSKYNLHAEFYHTHYNRYIIAYYHSNKKVYITKDNTNIEEWMIGEIEPI